MYVIVEVHPNLNLHHPIKKKELKNLRSILYWRGNFLKCTKSLEKTRNKHISLNGNITLFIIQ